MRLSLEIPEQLLADTDTAALARRIKLYAAMLMFQTGELSAGAAAELAEVDRYTFMFECRKRGIPTTSYPAEELRGEVRAVQQPTS